jgi:hypothetical protein
MFLRVSLGSPLLELVYFFVSYIVFITILSIAYISTSSLRITIWFNKFMSKLFRNSNSWIYFFSNLMKNFWPWDLDWEDDLVLTYSWTIFHFFPYIYKAFKNRTCSSLHHRPKILIDYPPFLFSSLFIKLLVFIGVHFVLCVAEPYKHSFWEWKLGFWFEYVP